MLQIQLKACYVSFPNLNFFSFFLHLTLNLLFIVPMNVLFILYILSLITLFHTVLTVICLFPKILRFSNIGIFSSS
jgi:hypothetical protein